MDKIIQIIITIVCVVVALWLITMIPFTDGLEILKTVLIVLVVVIGIKRVMA